MINEIKEILTQEQVKRFGKIILIGGGIFLAAILIEKYYNVVNLIRQAKLNKYKINEYENDKNT